jgi:hypothetical protein
MSRPAPDLTLVGQVLDGRYRIEALLGHGGMGAVYRASHVHLEQQVAIKILRPHLAGDTVAARRLAREARGTYKLDTEHAIKVSDFGVTEGGLVYLVMELLEGRTVHAELGADGPFAPARGVRVAAQVCDALAAAHRLNFIHRDIKPDNIMLIRRGDDPDFVKVLDFGLAKLIEGAGGAPFSVAALTQTDMVFGTPEYMAPEQAMGQTLDGRADIYAVGATLFEILAGRAPFVDPVPMKLLAKHVKAAPPLLKSVRPELDWPRPLEEVIQRCLAKHPDDRPQRAEDLAAELRALVPMLASTAPRVPAALASSATVDLGAAAPPAPALAPARPTDHVSSLMVRRSNKLLIGVMLVVLAGLGTVVAIAMTREPGAGASGSTSRSDAAVVASMQPIDAGVPDASRPVDAAAEAPSKVVDAPVRKPDKPDKTADPVDPELARHLAAAEAARRSRNRLRQLAEADAALAVDNRHVRARFLMGEALLETGDIANGCKYLKMAKRLREARAILDSGRCPAD